MYKNAYNVYRHFWGVGGVVNVFFEHKQQGICMKSKPGNRSKIGTINNLKRFLNK